LKLLDFGAL
jgi:hypothetical protein